MRVDIYSFIYHYRDGSRSTYTAAIPTHCCTANEEAWAQRFIGFGDYDSAFSYQEGVNIYSCSPYPEGAVWDEKAIQFCPFCGEPVEQITHPNEPRLICHRYVQKKCAECIAAIAAAKGE